MNPWYIHKRHHRTEAPIKNAIADTDIKMFLARFSIPLFRHLTSKLTGSRIHRRSGEALVRLVMRVIQSSTYSAQPVESWLPLFG